MPEHTIPSDGALGVELSTSQGCLRITFRPGDQRAFVVGRSAQADLRLRGPRIGGVAFHLERHGDRVELFPADTARELYVDGRRVTAALVLESTSVVDLPGERLVLTTFDATGLTEASSVRLAEAGLAYVAALPSENDTTRLGIESSDPDSDAIHELQTTTFVPQRSPHLDRTVSFDGRTTQRIDVAKLARTMPLGPTGTEVIRTGDLYVPPAPPPVQVITDKISRAELYAPPPAPRLEPVIVPIAPPAPAIVPVPVIAPAIAAAPLPLTLDPKPELPAPESRGPATTRFDLPATGTETTALDVRRMGLAAAPLAPSSPPASTWASDNATVMSPAPARHRLRIALRRLGRALRAGGKKSPGELVIDLGMLARRRPLAVAVGTVTVACALALALTGASRLAGFGKQPARPVAAATAKPVRAAPLPAAPVPAVVPSFVLRTAVPAPVPGTSAKPRPRGTPSDPEVATAVADLAAGRDAQARAAYTRLAARSPENPAYESLATLLARAASPDCQKGSSSSPARCPEVER